MDLDSADEIRLHGGMAINGRPAELVRVKKDGTAYSLATGKRVDDIEEHSKDAIRFKRSASQQAEDEEEIMRSMARRKMNAPPEEYAPKQCREPGCDKEFKRPCDLTKHEKTHSRPWKCPVRSCKFHEFGWPTEKEMDRHHNDKHSKAPPMYECLFKPCPYKSKRESNCKQHMEKAHNWTYVRTKTTTTNRKGDGVSPKQDSAPQVTPQLTNMPTPRSDTNMNVTTPPDGERIFDIINFPHEQFSPLSYPPEIHIDLSPPIHGSPSSSQVHDNSVYNDDFVSHEDIYSAPAQIPTPMYSLFDGKQMDQQLATFTAPQNQHMLPAHAPHFSPTGQENTMLYTPDSVSGLNEFCDDYSAVAPARANDGHDFLLFPPPELTKQVSFDPLFSCEMPIVAGNYSEPLSQTFMQTEWVAPSSQGYTGYDSYGQN